MTAGQPLPLVTYTFESAVDDVPDTWRVLALHATEALSQVYEITLDLAADDTTADPDDMLLARCSVTIVRDNLTRRFVGVIRRVEDIGATVQQTQRLARVTIVPDLWLLGQRVNSRIFQAETSNNPNSFSSVDIVRAVLDTASVYAGARFDTSAVGTPPPAREVCVQHRESDLAFVMRLLEEDGIGFYFQHEDDGEIMVLFDATQNFEPVETMDGAPVPVHEGNISAVSPTESVTRFEWTNDALPTGATVRDFNFTRPSDWVNMTRSHPKDPGAREIYEYPAALNIGGYSGVMYGTHNGIKQAEIRDVARKVGDQRGQGTSNVSSLVTGRLLTIQGHGRDSLNDNYLLTRIEHFGRSADHALPGAGNGVHGDGESADHDRYHNSFECVRASAPWRPAAATPRPVIHGAQTATVVGPAGEEIYVDTHGRIKVQFHWDRLSQNDEHSSAWVRTQQAWAGAQWGFVFLPRIGMEVVVTFLEGNPDRPLVTGCVYNGEHTTPYPLPDEKTKSTIKTNSSLGGGGYNELRFEDLAGSEEIYLQAQKDLNELVKHCHSTNVGADQSQTVGHDQTETINHDQTLVVKHDRTKTVTNKETITVNNERHTYIKPLDELTVDGTQNTTVNGVQNVTLNSGSGGAGDLNTTVQNNNTLTVHNEYNITADNKFHVTQHGNSLDVVDSAVTLTGATKIKFVVGSTTIEITSGKIELNTGAGASCVLDGNHATITATTLDLHGTTTTNIGDATIGVSGSAVTITGTTSVIASKDGSYLKLNGDAELTGGVVKLKP